jgi:uncharacterized protein YbbC (DUF1343 family)
MIPRHISPQSRLKEERSMRVPTNGLDKVAADPSLLAGLGRVGLVTNQAATTADFRSAAQIVATSCARAGGSTLEAVFGPQHGYWQTEQDNMIETPDLELRLPGGKMVPLLSLYSLTRVPTREQLAMVDTLVVDLCDVGCRVYTYMLTLAGCMRAGAEYGKAVVVLDRPNPLGLSLRDARSSRWTRVEGNILDPKWHSFVGWYSIPMRHGLSMGELGRYFQRTDGLDKLDYRVVEVEGLTRVMGPNHLRSAPWTLPSPNLPTWDCAWLFPSFVALEGTNVSEGRGTTLPFQIVGAPWLDADAVRDDLEGVALAYSRDPAADCGGVVVRRHDFRPTFNKHTKEWCRGLQFHPTGSEEALDRHNTFALGVWFLASVVARHEQAFDWKAPGYEYNFTDPPLNLIYGDDTWLTHFESLRGRGFGPEVLEATHKLLILADAQAQEFARKSAFAHIYPTPS